MIAAAPIAIAAIEAVRSLGRRDDRSAIGAVEVADVVRRLDFFLGTLPRVVRFKTLARTAPLEGLDFGRAHFLAATATDQPEVHCGRAVRATSVRPRDRPATTF